ncbi:pyruvate kinase [Fulvivirgaceae bacterium BMA12]|uniref:pyruvate kinase n=1 Tax=Agaribacillus aureus TaxID=3051825 RepID=A0ABT8LES2_9BACT|nr:pyruvate kinase [Fulvivirgaceae bacterium BMA12]
MKFKDEKLQSLIVSIEDIIQRLKQAESDQSHLLLDVHNNSQLSATNLIHYRNLREYDIRDLQKKLGNLGLSRLAKAESHIMASLLSLEYILKKMVDPHITENVTAPFSIKKSQKILAMKAKSLFGYRSKSRRVRIMVTQPTESAYNYELVQSMVAAGMNCARINCAHDSAEVWLKIIENVHRANEKLKRKCKITMDLGGPKIRTGAIVPGPKVKKFTPQRDEWGKVINPAQILLVHAITDESAANAVPVPAGWLSKLKVNDKISFTDTRDKLRALKIKEIGQGFAIANCYDAAYIATGTKFTAHIDGAQEMIEVGDMPAIAQSLLLKTGDRLIVHKHAAPGKPAVFDEEGQLLAEAHIGCTLPDIVNLVQPGEKIHFDDGKIVGKIQEVYPEKFIVEITYAKDTGAKLKADKGINLPETNLKISGLTEKDKNDLKFVARHADVVNMSFVNNPSDVTELIEEIRALDAQDKLGIILKIETQKGFNQLTEILLEAMKLKKVGVMIARGDLAIETGWDNIARIQNEMLAVCNAAHVPVVWATQVLENLAKKGIPSRSEITDAATSVKAECVMLNKGPHITQAIRLLDTILKGMENYQDKNAPMLPALEAVGS